MSYYAMQRGWMNHPIFRDAPFTEREAWCWLIENASYVPSKMRHKYMMINLGRGEVPTSYRNLADKWKWSVNRIRNFLDLLESDKMILRKTDTGFLIITICNYDKYQAALTNSDTHTDTAPHTLPDTQPDTNIIRENKGIIIDDDDSVREKTFFEKVQEATESVTPLQLTAVEGWKKQGLTEEIILHTIRAVVAKKKLTADPHPPNSMNYFKAAMATALAEINNTQELKNVSKNTSDNTRKPQKTVAERADEAVRKYLETLQ